MSGVARVAAEGLTGPAAVSQHAFTGETAVSQHGFTGKTAVGGQGFTGSAAVGTGARLEWPTQGAQGGHGSSRRGCTCRADYLISPF